MNLLDTTINQLTKRMVKLNDRRMARTVRSFQPTHLPVGTPIEVLCGDEWRHEGRTVTGYKWDGHVVLYDKPRPTPGAKTRLDRSRPISAVRPYSPTVRVTQSDAPQSDPFIGING